MRVIRVLLGTLAGGLIAAVIAAMHVYFTLYSPGEGTSGPSPAFAQAAAMVGAMGGFVAGAPLGLFLTLMQRGKVFGAASGALYGLAAVLFVVVTYGMLDWFSLTGRFYAALPPLGAVSGFLTSLVVPFSRPQEAARQNSLGLL